MSGQPEQPDPGKLSVPAKILLVQDLWDEIAHESGNVELAQAQREEAERRLLAHESSPRAYAAWEEIESRLEEER